MVRKKPTDLVELRLRIPESLRHWLETSARKRDTSINDEVNRLLELSRLAERAGVGGMEGVIQAVQSSSAASAVRETLKQLGIDTPQITKSSE